VGGPKVQELSYEKIVSGGLFERPPEESLAGTHRRGKGLSNRQHELEAAYGREEKNHEGRKKR